MAPKNERFFGSCYCKPQIRAPSENVGSDLIRLSSSQRCFGHFKFEVAGHDGGLNRFVGDA